MRQTSAARGLKRGHPRSLKQPNSRKATHTVMSKTTMEQETNMVQQEAIKEQKRTINALSAADRIQFSMRNRLIFTTGRSVLCSLVVGNVSKSSKCSKLRTIFWRNASIWPSTNSVPNADLSCSLTSSMGMNASELSLQEHADARYAQRPFTQMTERAGRSTSCTTGALEIHVCRGLEVGSGSIDSSEPFHLFEYISGRLVL